MTEATFQFFFFIMAALGISGLLELVGCYRIANVIAGLTTLATVELVLELSGIPV